MGGGNTPPPSNRTTPYLRGAPVPGPLAYRRHPNDGRVPKFGQTLGPLTPPPLPTRPPPSKYVTMQMTPRALNRLLGPHTSSAQSRWEDPLVPRALICIVPWGPNTAQPCGSWQSRRLAPAAHTP